jgi:hypothetical protein
LIDTDIDFQSTIRAIDCIQELLTILQSELALHGEMSFVACFADSARSLNAIGFRENVLRSTDISVSSITSRLFLRPNVGQNRNENDSMIDESLNE